MPTPVTGLAYVECISRRRSDRRARAAFQELALQLVRPGERVFDFGAGPGMDAKFYAHHGLAVGAYDVDAAMCEAFATLCRAEIAAGLVALNTGSYADFMASDTLRHGRDVTLVTANFAPFNLVADLAALFRKLHAITAPGGAVLASVLSPYFIGDLRYTWWWRNLRAFRRDGRYAVAGLQTQIIRRGLADYASQAAPYFALVDAWPGRPGILADRRAPSDRRRSGGLWSASLATHRFMFLRFERQER